MIRRFLLTLLAAIAAATAVGRDALDAARLARTADELCATPHRLAGTPEGRAAGDLILARLREAGIPDDWIAVQPFEVTQLRLNPGDCYFERNGQRVPLQPLRPNGMALPVTPPEGIATDTVYVAGATVADFRGKNLRGRIAVIDYTCGDRWMEAARDGAAAILFVGAPDSDQTAYTTHDAHHLNASFDLPRFYVDRDVAAAHGLLEGASIRLFSRMGFQRLQGRNLFVMIPGADPGMDGSSNLVALACAYDTFGPLPFATRNPDRAANVAALIEAAAAFRHDPPPRALLIAFFDNEAQAQAGQFQFHFARDAYSEENAVGTLLRMIAERRIERALLESKLAAMEKPVTVLEKQNLSPAAMAARQEVLLAAERIYNRAVTELSEVRREYFLLDRQVDRLEQQMAQHQQAQGNRDPEAAAAEEARLTLLLNQAVRARDTLSEPTRLRLETLKRNRDRLYQARKLLSAARSPAADTEADVRVAYEEIVSGVQAAWRARLLEQTEETAILESHQELGRRLNGRKLDALLVWAIRPAACRWTLLGPDATPNSIANIQMTRWIQERVDPAAGAFPECAGLVSGIESPAAATVAGRTSFVLELGSVGVSPGLPLPPREAAPDFSAFAVRAAEALAFCRELAARPELDRVRIPARLNAAIAFNVPTWDGNSRFDGCFVRLYDEKSKAGAPVPDAPVFIQNRDTWTATPKPHAWDGMWTSSSKLGTFSILAIRQDRLLIQAGLYDEQGQLTSISLRHPDGVLAAAGNWETPSWFRTEVNNQVILTEIRSRIRLAGIRAAAGAADERTVKFWDATAAAKPKRLNLGLSADLLTVYTGRLRGYVVLQGSQLLLNASPYEPTGIGCEPSDAIEDALARSARDVWLLDESRLHNLRRHNILENALERLHARAEQLLDAAETATDFPALARARRLASLAYSHRVYEPVRTVTNDLIKAVIILLLLAIPFSFALERVVSGSPNIYRQILGFAVTFGAVFTILYLVHPAFRFTSFPLVVLLAFVIIILSSIVIALMWSKFEYEVRKLHGVATASHQSTRTAQGTIAAAVSLGIATMRRRPLRTALTALTILLLTFTILFFGSFRSEDGIRTILVGPGTATTQVEIGSAPGKSFNPQSVAMLRLLVGESSRHYVRSWTVAEEGRVLAGRLPDDSVFTAKGVSTLPPPDLELYPELKQALSGDLDAFARDGGILLPAPLYDRIPESHRRAADGTPPIVHFEGRRYPLRGFFDPLRLKAVRTLDGAAFIPPDLVEVTRQLEIEYPRDPEAVKLKLDEMDLADLPLVDPETVCVVWLPQAEQAAAKAQSLVFLPRTEAAAREIAAESSILLDRRASLSVGGEHHRALYAKRLSLGGFSKVAVPLILGGLIIFGTMLSSVSDRQKEIFTFSALGLGPRHVAALFFAEASVYAVVGGMGGYLFAHAFSKLVEAMARLGWTESPAMNHSSMNAMLTLLIVMATVLISTIYPAIKASRSANPGAQRHWRMPEPEGNRLSLDFPFTVSEYDVIGLVSFLEEHLLSHHDKSVGLFAADRVEVRRDAEGRFDIRAMVWLQPFDQGVSQTFALRTDPSDIPGIERVHVEMVRLSGSPAIWRRSSRVFIHDLRSQFILWRTIPDEAADHYYKLTTERFMPAKGADA